MYIVNDRCVIIDVCDLKCKPCQCDEIIIHTPTHTHLCCG